MDLNETNPSGTPSILIVDDNLRNLQVLGKLLQDQNYSTEFAVNGEAALAWIRKKLFDLILLDINMPGMNGFETCTTIRSDKSYDNVPIIFLSADSDRESIFRGFEIGAQDYVTKPFDSRELLSRVRTHVRLKHSVESLEKLNRNLEQTVTERTLKLREAMAQVEIMNLKLIDLDKAKSEFLSLISHEIRTPLNGIVGPLEMIKEIADTSEVEELISILDTSIKRLEHFSYNALLITRLKTKPFEIHREEIVFPDLIQTVIADKGNAALARNIKIGLEINSSQKIISCEAELIRICATNVLENAIRYSPVNGVVLVQIYESGGCVHCLCKDNGPGFPVGSEETIFDLLAHGDERRDNSPGIGLALAKMIMLSHSGRLEIGNNKAGGAFVEMVLPVL